MIKNCTIESCVVGFLLFGSLFFGWFHSEAESVFAEDNYLHLAAQNSITSLAQSTDSENNDSENNDSGSSVQEEAGSDDDAHAGHDHNHEHGDHDSQETPAIVEEVEREPEFEKKFAQWKESLVHVYLTRAKFDFAELKDVPQVREDWVRAIEESDRILDELYETGIDVYERRGVKDSRIGQFLLDRAADAVVEGRYGIANRVYRAAEETGFSIPTNQLRKSAVSAFNCSEFVRANRLFRQFAMLGEESGSKNSQMLVAAIPELIAAKNTEQEKIDRDKVGEPLPRIRIKTTKGDMVVELFENDFPNTVARFIGLAEDSFFDGNPIVRRESILFTAGSTSIDGMGSDPVTIDIESGAENFRAAFRGYLVMLPSYDDAGTADSIFAICRGPIGTSMYQKWPAFGRIIEGEQVLPRLNIPNERSTNQFKWDEIVKVEVISKRDHDYDFEPAKDNSSE